MFRTPLLLYKGKYIPVGRPRFRKTLTRGWKQKSPEILLPPFIPIHELRIMLRLDYDTCFKACNVAVGEKNFYWKDKEGRQFFTDSKRSIILPFELAAYACKSYGYEPIMVNPEPVWDDIPSHHSIPVAVLIGHSNHGKSTLLDALSGTNYAKTESITQQMRSVTIDNELTLIDTPGHELFEILRGRCIHLADIALVVISLEFGGEIQTRDVIIQADTFNVPIIFVLTKADLPHVDPKVTIAELKNQLQNMFHEGTITKNYTKEAEDSIVISSYTGDNINELKNMILKRYQNSTLPCNPIKPITLGGESITRYQTFIRKSDSLVGANSKPSSVGLIVDLEKRHDRGLLLNVIIRHGIVVKGNYFVAGTAFGRVKKIYLDSDEVESAHVGHSVQIHGLKPYGDATTDDIFLTLPIDSAFRLSQYRRNVALIKQAQKSGRPVDIPFGVNTSAPVEPHIQHIAEEDIQDEPEEQESILLSGRDSRAPPVQTWSGPESRSDEVRGGEACSGGLKDRPEERSDEVCGGRGMQSRDVPRRPLEGTLYKDEGVNPDERSDEGESRDVIPRCIASITSGIYPEEQGSTPKSEGPDKDRGVYPDSGSGILPEPCYGSFEDASTKDRGVYPEERRSTLKSEPSPLPEEPSPPIAGCGKNSRGGVIPDPEGEALAVRSFRVLKRWDTRMQQRELELKRQAVDKRALIVEAEQLRRRVLGEPQMKSHEIEEFLLGGIEDNKTQQESQIDVQKKLVVSVIMRTSFVGSLDMLLDGFEKIEVSKTISQDELQVKIPLVHGGIGPIGPNDVIHAEIENRIARNVPIYAYQVPILPDAIKHAIVNKIKIIKFDLFSDLLNHLRSRCINEINRIESLKKRDQCDNVYPGDDV